MSRPAIIDDTAETYLFYQCTFCHYMTEGIPEMRLPLLEQGGSSNQLYGIISVFARQSFIR